MSNQTKHGRQSILHRRRSDVVAANVDVHRDSEYVDPEAIDYEDGSSTSSDVDEIITERLPLLLEGSDHTDVAVHDIHDDVSKKRADAPASSAQPHRVRSIDLLRGLSVLGMVLVHYMIYYGNEKAMESMLYFVLSDGLGNVGAAGFLVLSGMSHALAVDGRFRKAATSGTTWKECDEFRCTWTRSLKLLGVELLMLALAWGPREMIKWDILTLQASSTLVLYVCRRLPSWMVAAISAAIALATPALRSLPAVDFAAAWGGGFRDAPFTEKLAPGLVYDPVAGDLEVRWDVQSIAQGYLLTGIFPLFPWLLFPLVGRLLGRRIVSNQFRHDVAGVAIIGTTFMVLGMGGALLSCYLPDASVVTGYLSPLSFYPDSFTMVLVQLGFVLVVIPLAYYHYDVRNKLPAAGSRTRSLSSGDSVDATEPVLHRAFYLTSRWALPIYFLHYICISWPLAVRYYLGPDGTYPIFDWMGAGPAFLAGSVAVAGLLGLAFVLENGWPRSCSPSCSKRRPNCHSNSGSRRRQRSMASRLSRRLSTLESHRRLSLTFPVV
jgi:uncharacterized membrane protein